MTVYITGTSTPTSTLISQAYETTTQEVTYGESYTLPTPTKEGYTFTGWTYNGEAFIPGATYDHAQDITLIASYTANS